MEKKLIRLKDAKYHELGSVPVTDYLNLFYRASMLLSASIFAGIGTGSVFIGISVLCSLLYLGNKE